MTFVANEAHAMSRDGTPGHRPRGNCAPIWHGQRPDHRHWAPMMLPAPDRGAGRAPIHCTGNRWFTSVLDLGARGGERSRLGRYGFRVRTTKMERKRIGG